MIGAQRFQAVTFDATGTLIHSPDVGQIYSDVLGRHGLAVDPGSVTTSFRTAWREFDCSVPAGVDRFTLNGGDARAFWHCLIARVCALEGVSAPTRFASAEIYERFRSGSAWALYPDVLPTLEKLREQQVPLAVVSNHDERLHDILEALGLRAFFETVVTPKEAGAAKPAAQIFRMAAEQLGCAPEKTLHVGDEAKVDAEGAVAAGLRACLLDRAGRAPSSTGQDHYWKVCSLAQLHEETVASTPSFPVA